jgi:hypothetical protein
MMHLLRLFFVLHMLVVAPVVGLAEENDRQPQRPSRPEPIPQAVPQMAVPKAVACFRGGQVLRCTSCETNWHCSGTGDGSCQPPSDKSCDK